MAFAGPSRPLANTPPPPPTLLSSPFPSPPHPPSAADLLADPLSVHNTRTCQGSDLIETDFPFDFAASVVL